MYYCSACEREYTKEQVEETATPDTVNMSGYIKAVTIVKIKCPRGHTIGREMRM